MSDYGKNFKSLCDQLVAIGHFTSDDEKTHLFLCSLGSAFETFSTAYRAVQPRHPYHDPLALVEGHEFFLTSFHVSSTPQASFTTSQQPYSQINTSRE